MRRWIRRLLARALALRTLMFRGYASATLMLAPRTLRPPIRACLSWAKAQPFSHCRATIMQAVGPVTRRRAAIRIRSGVPLSKRALHPLGFSTPTLRLAAGAVGLLAMTRMVQARLLVSQIVLRASTASVS